MPTIESVNYDCEFCDKHNPKYRHENDKFMCDECYEKGKPISDEADGWNIAMLIDGEDL